MISVAMGYRVKNRIFIAVWWCNLTVCIHVCDIVQMWNSCCAWSLNKTNVNCCHNSWYFYISCVANSDVLSHPSLADTALEWNNVTLSCSASAVPLPNVTWEKEGGVTPPTTTVLTTLSRTPNTVSTVSITVILYHNIANYGSDNKWAKQEYNHSLP